MPATAHILRMIGFIAGVGFTLWAFEATGIFVLMEWGLALFLVGPFAGFLVSLPAVLLEN